MKNGKNQKVLNLIFPQWQGSGDSKELFYGAQAIKQQLCNIEFSEVSVSLETKNDIQFGIYAFAAIHEQLKNACEVITSTNPDKILTIGGDCGVEVAPVSFLNKKYFNDLTVIWFDAHGDLNIPEESSSNHFHGMPLRTLLGDGNKNLTQSCFSSLSTKQIILSGGRDFDKAEKDFIKKNNIKGC